MTHKPTEETRDKISRYAAVGIPHDDISKIIGIDKKTMYKYYRDELDTAAAKANAAVGGALYNKAINGDTAAQIWWTKARLRWSEKVDSNVNNRYVDKDGEDLHRADKELLKKLGIDV